jgi:hypothetical protein
MVYADRIKDELKSIAKTPSDLNAHAMHPHLVKGGASNWTMLLFVLAARFGNHS